MIRLLSIIIFFTASSIVLAEPLYKWVEADGSITFSVKPPAAGVSYETVSSSGLSQKPAPEIPESADVDAAPALQRALPENRQPNEVTQRLAPQQGVQSETQVRSQNATTDQSELTSRYVENRANNIMGKPAEQSGVSTQNSAGSSVEMSAKNRKQRQCEDLKKRVISLEGRLKTRLTPDDMDNTVVHMARYQRSYDQHCVQ